MEDNSKMDTTSYLEASHGQFESPRKKHVKSIKKEAARWPE